MIHFIFLDDRELCHERVKSDLNMFWIHVHVPNAPFLYPLKTSETLMVF